MVFKRRSRLRSPKFAKHRRRVLLLKGVIVLFSLSAIVGSLAFISRDQSLKISYIDINGNSVVTNNDLLSLVNNKLSGKYLYLFPKSNIILYPRKDIEASVLHSFNRIDDADIRFENLKSISLSVHEREPYALWCEEKIDADKDVAGRCYFLDKSGYIFTLAPDFTGNVYFRFYGLIDSSESGEGPVGKSFLEEGEFQRINRFLSLLQSIDINTIILVLNNENDFELHLEKGGMILFRRDQDLSHIFDNIQSVFESEEFRLKNLDELDYADFRFGNKVYFKFE
jgi:cell division septal protein FtsQ